MDTDGLHIKYMYFTMHKNIARHLFERKPICPILSKVISYYAKQTTIKTGKENSSYLHYL